MTEPANPLRRLGQLGQSVWYDHIHRGMLLQGELGRLVSRDALRGVTSNPAIFERALATGDDYDPQIRAVLARDPNRSPRDLFYDLAISDVRDAADQLLGVYESSAGVDGMVSLEVSPLLANDVVGTVCEALELYRRVDRPNVMIKVPGTEAGVEAFSRLTEAGLNINVTLLFSVERYEAVARAFLAGLTHRHAKGLAVDHINSVASFFVSRVDAVVDALLAEQHCAELRGKAAIANAKLAYQHYLRLYREPFATLRAAGARPQRLLWASTGTKNPAYSDVLYVEALVGEDTVNTIPPPTYEAYRDHGDPRPTLSEGVAEAESHLRVLRDRGVDLTAISDRLEREGVAAFAQAFENVLASLAAKCTALAA